MKQITIQQKEINLVRFNSNHLPNLMNIIFNADRRVFDVIINQQATLPEINDMFASCYLYGEIGSGKTVMAAWRMLCWARNQYVHSIPNISCLFITADKLLQEIRNSYNSKNGDNEQTIIEKYENIDMLVIDEFGLISTTDWSFRILFMIINYRYSHYKPTIYTSNMALDELATILGDDRIPSRIQHDCGENIFHFTNQSLRKPILKRSN